MALGVVAGFRFAAEEPAEVIRFAVEISPQSGGMLREMAEPVFGSRVAMSPDGRTLVYATDVAGIPRLVARRLDQMDGVPIPGTEGGSSPFFSPDGQWVGFFASGELRKVPLGGGAPMTLCDVPGALGASWGEDDVILIGQFATGLLKVSANGGVPELATSLIIDEATSTSAFGHRQPEALPGGAAMLFTVYHEPMTSVEVAVLAADDGAPRVLLDGADPRYSPTGHIVFVRGDALWAVAFDLERLELTGEPTPVVDDVLTVGGVGAMGFALSKGGSLAYIPVTAAPRQTLAWVDRSGQATPFGETRGGATSILTSRRTVAGLRSMEAGPCGSRTSLGEQRFAKRLSWRSCRYGHRTAHWWPRVLGDCFARARLSRLRPSSSLAMNTPLGPPPGTRTVTYCSMSCPRTWPGTFSS